MANQGRSHAAGHRPVVGTPVKIVITECDHDSFAIEQQVADSVGAELQLTNSHSAQELVANAAEADGILVQYAQITAEVMEVISLHTPLTDLTRAMIAADQFARMRPDAILVNTSRGAVVDTDALVEALRSGRIRGAALDVLETEPLPLGHPLTTFDSVVLTPHLAWYTEESYAELKHRTIANVVEVCSDRTPRNIINPEVLGMPGRNSGYALATSPTGDVR